MYDFVVKFNPENIYTHNVIFILRNRPCSGMLHGPCCVYCNIFMLPTKREPTAFRIISIFPFGSMVYNQREKINNNRTLCLLRTYFEPWGVGSVHHSLQSAVNMASLKSVGVEKLHVNNDS